MRQQRRQLIARLIQYSTYLPSLFLLGTTELAMGASLLGIRIWPAEEYTRVTLETDEALDIKHQLIPNPNRLVVDISGLDLNSSIREIVAKVQKDDPFIASVRVGQYQPKVVRLVFDLKEEINPQLFTLGPIGNYKTRLVFDLYPKSPPDPMAVFLRQNAIKSDEEDLIAQITRNKLGQIPSPSLPETFTATPKSTHRRFTRTITIAIDPGHGGEDPGAIGSTGTMEKDIVLSIAKKLKDIFDDTADFKTFLTRDADYFVPLVLEYKKLGKYKQTFFIYPCRCLLISICQRSLYFCPFATGGNNFGSTLDC
jgi:N-acetylmuramoyl-L-alanine amidase